jgi:DNA-binding XRE family transcriptional regulator
MTKKDIVELAEVLRIHNQTVTQSKFTPIQLGVLADFYGAQYPNFSRERWIEYIAGVNRHEGGRKSYLRIKSDKKGQQNVLQSLLRQLRTDAGLKQKEISKALGKPQSFVSYYETGAKRLDLLELCEVCEVLGISLVTFVSKFEKELLDPTLPTIST